MGSRKRPMYVQVVLMQLFVDCFVALTPFAALAEHFHAHILTMPWSMLHTFIVAFFYDSILQMILSLWDIFSVDLDDLHLDPILVLAERSTFANLGLSEKADLPGPLSKKWAEMKDAPDDAKGDKKDKDKKDKGDDGEGKDKKEKK